MNWMNKEKGWNQEKSEEFKEKNGSEQRNGEELKSYGFTKTPCIGTKKEISK